VPSLEETVEKVDAVDAAATRAAAERIVSAGALALALYGPVEAAPSAEALNARLVA
jgi:hypothetical protein